MREAATAKAEAEKQAPAPVALIPRPVALQTIPITAPQPKPTPTIQARKPPNQPTAYSNRIMTPSPQTTNLAETMKQMQDPKVTELFQVLRQIIQIAKSENTLADRAMQVAAFLQLDIAL
ncbi:hypothetical protein TNCT_659381 [Trichonephila clavata]|uniref:Uncharacterized protein n=1 Tax=Trichonephila clavata TaxID=2740835 RepID=A0A8X6HTE7_TRICU|nr:hypothetical protein TNCT_659381 [Trichonephila clavata]